MLQLYVIDMTLKTTNWNSEQHPPGANELKTDDQYQCDNIILGNTLSQKKK